jgi:hypothetical protein
MDLVARYELTERQARNRLAWQGLAPKLEQVMRSRLGETFGGAWIDHTRGGRLIVGVTSSPAAVLSQVPAEFADVTDVVAVQHSLDDLEALVDELWTAYRRVPASQGWDITVGVMPQHNSAFMHVPPLRHRNALQDEFIHVADARYEDMLLIEEVEESPSNDACTPNSATPYCDPPLRSGIGIHYGTAVCSSGFPARSRTDGKLYLLTAGHCARTRNASSWWTRFPDQSLHAIGPVHNCQAGRGPANNCSQGDGDMAILRVNNPSGWQQGRGWVFVRPSANNKGVQGTVRDETYPIRRTGFTGQPLSGFRVCKSGRISTSCGEVVAVSVRYSANGYEYRWMAAATYARSGGDSGAPIYAGGTAYGLHSGVSGGFGIYQGINAAQNVLNVNILLE